MVVGSKSIVLLDRASKRARGGKSARQGLKEEKSSYIKALTACFVNVGKDRQVER